MRPFRDVSIRTKLTALMMVVVSLVVVLLCIAFMINRVRVFKASLIDQHSALADVVGANSTAALDFFDVEAGEAILSSLRLEPTVLFACTYDAGGAAFATYQARGILREPPSLPNEIGAPFFESGQLHVFAEIINDGELIGSIYLCGSTEQLNRYLLHDALILTIVLSASLLLVYVIAVRLQRVISNPILHMVEATQEVSSKADYSIRVEKSGGDEVGILADGFNEMLTQIEQRDAELTGYRNDLEALVRERTEDLDTRTQELARVNRELTRSNKDLDDFAYIASHDLKEPLRGISNYATFLEEDYGDKLDDEGRLKLETLRRLCRRLDQLITSLLHYSRVGRADLAIEETDLNAMVNGILDSLSVTLEDEHVQVRIPRSLPTIVCDGVRVREVFHNLIANAVKYNDKAEKWVEIGYREPDETAIPGPSDAASSDPVRSPVFYVRDNGIGIREKHLDAVFRIFKRLHGRDKYGGGTGAGLTFVKQIVERHGGRVWVESVYGEGSTFCFTLQRNSHVAPQGD